MSKKDCLKTLAEKMAGNNTKCGTVCDTLNCIATKLKGSEVKETTICRALEVINDNVDDFIENANFVFNKLYGYSAPDGSGFLYCFSVKEKVSVGDYVFKSIGLNILEITAKEDDKITVMLNGSAVVFTRNPACDIVPANEVTANE